MRRRQLVASLSLLAAAGLLPAPRLGAQQAAWPARPIRMIVPYTPGAATDATARLAAQRLEEKLGVPVVVENRGGANGTIGTAFVAQAAPDGYTILGSDSTHPMAPHVMRDVPYDPVRDFTPLARTARGPVVMVMSARLPQPDFATVLAAMRAQPDAFSFGVASMGAAGTMASIELNRVTGTRTELVLYRGAAPALTDLAAGNVALMFSPIPSVLPLVRAGQLRPLMIATRARSAFLPEVPTAAELGLADFEFHSWYGVWGPKGLPPEIAARLNATLTAAMQEPATRERLTALGFEPVNETLEEITRFIVEDTGRNAALLRLAQFRP